MDMYVCKCFSLTLRNRLESHQQIALGLLCYRADSLFSTMDSATCSALCVGKCCLLCQWESAAFFVRPWTALRAIFFLPSLILKPLFYPLSTIDDFAKISGYKMNYDKSEALPQGNLGDQELLSNFPFRWSNTGFTYLGIKVTYLYELNLHSVIAMIKSLLKRWFDLPLSWMGKISLFFFSFFF